MYHLLRNNIVTGPFTREALLQQGILHTDQLRTADSNEWRAAASFAEFKDALAYAPKPKFKITANKELIEIKKEPEPPMQQPTPPVNSPFKRTPSAVPKKRANDLTVNDKKTPEKETHHTAAKPLVHHIDSAPRLEKTERKKTVAPKPSKAAGRDNNSSITKELVLPLLIIGGIGAGVWFGYKKMTSDDAAPTAIVQTPVTADSTIKKPFATTSTHKSEKTITMASVKHVKDSAMTIVKKDSVIKAKKDTLSRTARANIAIDSEDAGRKKIPKIETKITENSTPAIAPHNTGIAAVKPVEKKPVAKQKFISDYVTLSLNKTPDKEVKNIKINVKNISDQPLNIAIIDVSYTDADGKIIRGETLQAENIGTGKTASVKVPNEKKATNITYKVSLISGDSVYLMGK
ncbi:hypothetical protein A9P82_05255 [Arachidicoccus ginsenosidimutans]|uniref:hypothetical protein n=1 Tax=Arachidicoccus sp. BS20 TaxID=1850526 RepID=UPI0007F08B1C|nr:hypothetical protein [Arachidicoccus sp. BS20]ANI88743.1 hypothetical protein A9P82_05255 [Arachidicoccus sp. BS20]